MPKVKHPRIPNVTYTVPAEKVADWVASGWVADEPKPARKKTAPSAK